MIPFLSTLYFFLNPRSFNFLLNQSFRLVYCFLVLRIGNIINIEQIVSLIPFLILNKCSNLDICRIGKSHQRWLYLIPFDLSQSYGSIALELTIDPIDDPEIILITVMLILDMSINSRFGFVGFTAGARIFQRNLLVFNLLLHRDNKYKNMTINSQMI